jgi:uncharacterized NAD-dependent epimerase/dehydratase family protein
MHNPRRGAAVVFCAGAFNTTNGKTAHGLVRRSLRWPIAAVIDPGHIGLDAGQVLDGRPAGIPIVADLEAALAAGAGSEPAVAVFVYGVAPDGGRLAPAHRPFVVEALRRGLQVVSGLHDLLGDDPELTRLALRHGGALLDVRRPPPRSALHFFDGRIAQVGCPRLVVLGTDSAVGKRTTAWLLCDALVAGGLRAELVGTGQTAWMQGAPSCVLIDTLVNDFVAGEIEHTIWSAWQRRAPELMLLEGQGSLLHPAYPGGFELLAAGRPQLIVLQHAPGRRDYDGFAGWPVHPLKRQLQAVRAISDSPVIALAINHEGLTPADTVAACAAIHAATGLPALDPLLDGAQGLAALVRQALAALEPAA